MSQPKALHVREPARMETTVARAAEKAAQRVRTRPLEKGGQAAPEELDRQANRYRGTYYVEGLTDRKCVALTFDDGPARSTRDLLAVLRRHDVRATFFWRGARVESDPDTGQAAIEDGHTIANHSYSHPHCDGLALDAFWRDEVARTQAVFERHFGFAPVLFRAPYGEITDAQVELLRGKGMKVIAWSIDVRDWLLARHVFGRRKIVNAIVGHAHPEAIVLMHDGGGSRGKTVAAVDEVVPIMRGRGYRFVTVDALIGVSARLAG